VARRAIEHVEVTNVPSGSMKASVENKGTTFGATEDAY
jgi:hypothetical protein